jgi:hypothetical protein
VSGELRFVHDTGFVEAFSNTDHTVLGKRLDPFCLWHQLNLEVAQSKILTGDKLTPLDLWIAVRICTTPWTPHHRAPVLKPPGTLKFLWDVGRFNFAEEVAKMSAYLVDYSMGPRFWPNQHESKEGAGDRDMDEILEMVSILIHLGGVSLQEAWTMPIGAARWLNTALLKVSGNKVDIWTDQHEVAFQEHKRKREAKIDERGKEIAAAENIPFEAAREKASKEYWANWKEQQERLAAISKARGR